jgi:histidyl-tRNA synthetase
MFRHEKPQSGRFRQFHQVGAEAIGSDILPVDVEVLALLHHFFEELTISGLSLHLNSIGCRVCRPAIRDRFVAFAAAHEEMLCAECRVRLTRNPLRILDCKNPSCQALMADAPRPAQDLCAACISHFGEVQRLLTLLGISFVLNDRLVRGLDYYSRTTFEFVNPRLGAQNALAGGGRYDGLVEELGGPPTPAVGFALGIERVVASLPKTRAEERDAVSGVYIATHGKAAWEAGVLLVQDLRREGIHALLDLEGRSLRGQMRQANKEKVRYCLILGEDELAKKTVTVKEMATGGQQTIPRGDIVVHLQSHLGREA